MLPPGNNVSHAGGLDGAIVCLLAKHRIEPLTDAAFPKCARRIDKTTRRLRRGRHGQAFCRGNRDLKFLKCDVCDHVAEGEGLQDRIMALRPDYMEAHSGVMNNSSRGKDQIEAWLIEN